MKLRKDNKRKYVKEFKRHEREARLLMRLKPISKNSQYLKKNIPDARAWMTTTQEAIDSVNEVLVEISGYCNQGVNDYNTVAERETLVASLKELRNQIYADGDADYAGRTVFTGYKTDSTLTFQEDEPDTDYTINETFDFKDVNNDCQMPE